MPRVTFTNWARDDIEETLLPLRSFPSPLFPLPRVRAPSGLSSDIFSPILEFLCLNRHRTESWKSHYRQGLHWWHGFTSDLQALWFNLTVIRNLYQSSLAIWLMKKQRSGNEFKMITARDKNVDAILSRSSFTGCCLHSTRYTKEEDVSSRRCRSRLTFSQTMTRKDGLIDSPILQVHLYSCL